MSLESRMKTFETKHNQSIKPYNSFILKLDGINFSKYTQGFARPYDKIFRISMIETMNELLKYTNAASGYTQSDEISLIFPALCKIEDYEKEQETGGKIVEHMRSGRVVKLCTSVASYCSLLFYLNIQKNINLINHSMDQKVLDRLKKSPVCFDCRAIEYSGDQFNEIINHQIWRLHDCKRNAILVYGETHYGKNKILGIKTPQLLEQLTNDNISIPNFIMCGVYGKKQLYMKDDTQRSHITNKVLDFKYSDELLDLLFAKYWYNDVSGKLDEKYKLDIWDITTNDISKM